MLRESGLQHVPQHSISMTQYPVTFSRPKALFPNKSGLLLSLSLLLATTTLATPITVHISGTIESADSAMFEVGRGYTFEFTVDTTTPPSLDFGFFARYDAAATNIKFNYDSGAYVGTAEYLSVWLLDLPEIDGFSIGLPFEGDVSFPLVDGYSLFNVSGNPVIDLVDYSGSSLFSTALTDPSGIIGFVSGDDDKLRLRWGADIQRSLVGSVDTVTTTQTPTVPDGGVASVGLPVLFAMILLRRGKART